MYDSKKKESQLVLVNELIVQLNGRVDYLIRQKTILRMCNQDIKHVVELLLSVTPIFSKNKGAQGETSGRSFSIGALVHSSLFV